MTEKFLSWERKKSSHGGEIEVISMEKKGACKKKELTLHII